MQGRRRLPPLPPSHTLSLPRLTPGPVSLEYLPSPQDGKVDAVLGDPGVQRGL